VKAHCLPFSQIPHSSGLFNDYLAYSSKVKPLYPRSPQFAEWMKDESGRISYDPGRRELVTAILERQNKEFGSGEKTLANLDRLRKGAAAVVTGQQVGLFGGPAFCLYKALTAVKLAAEATAAGVDAVPIFWLATYDHDLVEVNHVSLLGAENALETLTTSTHGVAGAPVSSVRLGEEILPLLDQAAALVTALGGDAEAMTHVRESYRSGESMGTAFARLYAKWFADWGVILLDASDAELHRIAAPIYTAAVERADELSTELIARGNDLEIAGYHQQVKVTNSSVLLFTMQNGARAAIHRRQQSGEDEFLIGGEGSAEKISRASLLERIQSAPEQFSPNVLLRPTVEDYLLPTLTYVGGAAEVAYFAQAGVVYEALLGRVTPILPRFSASLVEPKIERLLERYSLTLPDVFGGFESLRQKLAAHSLPGDLQAAFDATRKALDANLAGIKEKLGALDRTLVDAADTAGSKIQHQLEKLHAQAARAEALKGALIARHAESLSNALYPLKGLQERTIGGLYFLSRYGADLLHQLYDVIHTDCHDHQIIEL
jgi:bacillithiol biosynthesis cysteine-adding enzyme BshC